MKKIGLVISLIALVFAFTVNSASAQKVTSADKASTEKVSPTAAPAKACCAKSEAKSGCAKEGEKSGAPKSCCKEGEKSGCAKSCSKAEAKSCGKGEAKPAEVPVPKKN